jgi:hypothetical protein
MGPNPSSFSRCAKISADRVTFYEVPLACPAARNLGCGSAAKPILLGLEKRPTVQEAWLDHAGTTLAIVSPPWLLWLCFRRQPVRSG